MFDWLRRTPEQRRIRKLEKRRRGIMNDLEELHREDNFCTEFFLGHDVYIRRIREIRDARHMLQAELERIEKELGIEINEI